MLDFAKGALIILVVLGHSIQYSVYSNQGFWNDPIFEFIYAFHMPMFIYISGYISLSKMRCSVGELYDRLNRLLIPIITWVLLYLSIKVTLINKSLPSLHEIVSAIFSSFWYLWALLVITIFAFLSRKFHPVFSASVVCLSAVGLFYLHGFWFFSEILYLLPFYFLGGLSAWIGLHAVIKKVSRWSWIIIFAVSLILLINFKQEYYIYQAKNSDFDFFVYFYRFLIGCSFGAIFMGLCWYIDQRGSAAVLAIRNVGSHTLCIYILSSYVQPKMVGLSTPLMPFASAVAVSVVLVFCFYTASNLISRWSVTRLLLQGEKN